MPDAPRTPNVHPSWLDVLQPEFEQEYMRKLRAFLVEEKAKFTLFPPGPEIFSALNSTPRENVRVVILGQDPYHGPGQAHGLCFSVQRGVPIPPSLRNIYAEMQTDLGIPPATHGCLTSWAEQGALLLNSVLTVRSGAANSHKGQGWERFTDRVVEVVNSGPPTAFILWGRPAQDKAARIDGHKHFIVRSPHPSPLSAYSGFFGSRPFSAVNRWLETRGQPPIDWAVR